MTNRFWLISAATVAAVAMSPATAAATPAAGDVERTSLAEGTTDAPVTIVAVDQPTTLYIDNVVLGPAATSGWHTHPGPEYTVINAGTVRLQTAGHCEPAAFTSGQAVFIPAGVPHNVFNDTADDAEAVVTYTLPADRPIRDDAPAACP